MRFRNHLTVVAVCIAGVLAGCERSDDVRAIRTVVEQQDADKRAAEERRRAQLERERQTLQQELAAARAQAAQAAAARSSVAAASASAPQ